MAYSGVDELKELLQKDRSVPHPIYPEQAEHALADERVAQAIEERLQKECTLIGIESLGYDFLTGLNRIFFEFAPATGSIGVKRDAGLVLLDHSCAVVGVVAAFDPDQPNPRVPVLPERGEKPFLFSDEDGDLPFVLAQPSVTKNLVFSRKQLYPREVRNRQFFEKLAPNITVGQSELSFAGTSSDMSTLTYQN